MPDDEIKTNSLTSFNFHVHVDNALQYSVSFIVALLLTFCFQKQPGCVHQLVKLCWFVDKVVQAGPAGPPALLLL